MKALNQLAAIVLGLVLGASTTYSQEQYSIEFTGYSVSTNENGALVKRPLNNQAFYRECIADLGITNKPKLSLVYNVGADFNGDVMEVRRTRDGELLCQKLRLLFATSVSNLNGTETHQHVHVFTMEPGDPIGEGKVVRKTTKGRTQINGELVFMLPAEGTNSLKICRATFHSIRRINN